MLISGCHSNPMWWSHDNNVVYETVLLVKWLLFHLLCNKIVCYTVGIVWWAVYCPVINGLVSNSILKVHLRTCNGLCPSTCKVYKAKGLSISHFRFFSRVLTSTPFAAVHTFAQLKPARLLPNSLCCITSLKRGSKGLGCHLGQRQKVS